MRVILSDDAKKQLAKLDKPINKAINNYLKQIEKLADPRVRGKRLVGNLNGYWRYRVGDYRLICKIVDDKLIIIVVTIGHRKEIYNTQQ